MTAAEARALHGKLLCIEDDLAADRRALGSLGRWLTRFTPIVSSEWDEDDTDPPAVLWLDLTGCERLFGGITQLANMVTQALQRFNIPASIAVAPTVGSAWAFAKTASRSQTIVDASELHRAILPLPVTALRLHDGSLANLQNLGLTTIGDVLALPRASLAARFGPLLIRRLDQLTGALFEPLTKLVFDPPVTALQSCDMPIESPSQIALVFEQLLQFVLTHLARRGHGIRTARLVLTPHPGWGRPLVKREIALSRPHRHRKTLLELIGREIERIDCEHGFVAFRLDVPGHEAIAETQDDLFKQPHAEQMEFDLLLQRLRGRLGSDAVIRPHLVESYLPERAWRPARDGEATTTTFAVALPPRPLTLLPTPTELFVLCELSDDRTGRPCQFTYQREVHRLVHVVGPERIAGEWWRGHRRTRDYFDVEDETGRRFWIFRVLNVQPPDCVVARWFLHGRFD